MLRPRDKLASQSPGYGREALDEFLEGVVVLQILEEGLYGHACAAEDRSSPENLRVNGDEIRRVHVWSIPLDSGCGIEQMLRCG